MIAYEKVVTAVSISYGGPRSGRGMYSRHTGLPGDTSGDNDNLGALECGSDAAQHECAFLAAGAGTGTTHSSFSNPLTTELVLTCEMSAATPGAPRTSYSESEVTRGSVLSSRDIG